MWLLPKCHTDLCLLQYSVIWTSAQLQCLRTRSMRTRLYSSKAKHTIPPPTQARPFPPSLPAKLGRKSSARCASIANNTRVHQAQRRLALNDNRGWWKWPKERMMIWDASFSQVAIRSAAAAVNNQSVCSSSSLVLKHQQQRGKLQRGEQQRGDLQHSRMHHQRHQKPLPPGLPNENFKIG